MTVQQAIAPYMRQAETDLEGLQDLRDQLHDLVIDTAGRVGRDRDSSQSLLDALEGFTAALLAFQRGLDGLVTQRATELWLTEYPGG